MGRGCLRPDAVHSVIVSAAWCMRLLRRFDEGTVATLLMAGMLLVMSAQVTSRYVFNSPLAWTEEALRYMYVWMVFLGGSAAFSDRGHIAMTVFSDMLPPRGRLYLHLATDTLLAAYVGLLFYLGAQATMRYHHYPLSVLDWVPYSVVYLVIPISCATMLVRIVARMKRDWQDHRGDSTPDFSQKAVV